MKILRSAQKQLRRLPPEEAITLINALTYYQEKQQGYIKWLEGRPGYRIKIDGYRVIFEFDDQSNELIILKFLDSKTKTR